jgi:protein tyrosine phosphatase (PTP) superfamily phosphohydrolase (DUF442 family)
MPTPLQAIAGVTNACQPVLNLVTGGQPAPAHLEALKAAGVTRILDIRDPMEPRPFDEPALLRSLGVEYVNIPVQGGALSENLLERILDVLRSWGDAPVFFHCASGNRVGGALIPYFILDHKMDEEEAKLRAMRVGLRSAELLEWGLEYARRRREGT